MYGIDWDVETGGIKLRDIGEGSVLPTVRPVFYEELDLLGFDDYWTYPRIEEPLLWNINRTYYYKGRKIARVVGGGFFSEPKLEIYEKNLELEPVDVSKMIQKNKHLIDNATFRTLDFIRKIREKYKNYKAVVGFSGGKDSSVLLDLVQRALPPDEFIVIFNDTTKELTPTYEYVIEMTKYYPNIQFFTVRNDRDAIEFWKEFGPPSRVHRWCCTVLKTLPTVKFIREKFGENARILFYDGIRAEENAKRAKLDKASRGKNFRQINVHPIQEWNSAMIYLYIFMRGLPMNEVYRYGAVRVGCSVCPFESVWWETITWKKYRGDIEPFIEVIKDYARKRKVKDVENFIREGNWKARVGGDGWQRNRVVVAQKKESVSIHVNGGSLKKFLEWVKIIGDRGIEGDKIKLNFNGRDYILEIKSNSKDFTISVESPSVELVHALKLVASKSAYCISCGACEIECANGAISFNNGHVLIDSARCVHCRRCAGIADRGCLVADSLKVRYEGSKMGLKKIGNYKHFGIRKGWLEEFFRDPEKWWTENTLGPVQFEAMRKWLSDAEIIDSKRARVTETGKILREIGADDLFTWAVIWTNLAKNSSLISWYVNNLEWGKTYTREELLELMGDNLSLATRKNGLQSLVELLEKTPIGNALRVGIIIREGNKFKKIQKLGYLKMTDFNLSPNVILYALYRLKEDIGTNYFSISYLCSNSIDGGTYKIFGIRKELLEKILRSLQEEFGREWISVDISADLDNVSLNPSKSSIEVLKMHLKGGK